MESSIGLLFIIALTIFLYISSIYCLKSLNEEGMFDKLKRPYRILIRFVIFIFAPIILPIVIVLIILYFIFEGIIKIMFE